MLPTPGSASTPSMPWRRCGAAAAARPAACRACTTTWAFVLYHSAPPHVLPPPPDGAAGRCRRTVPPAARGFDRHGDCADACKPGGEAWGRRAHRRPTFAHHHGWRRPQRLVVALPPRGARGCAGRRRQRCRRRGRERRWGGGCERAAAAVGEALRLGRAVRSGEGAGRVAGAPGEGCGSIAQHTFVPVLTWRHLTRSCRPSAAGQIPGHVWCVPQRCLAACSCAAVCLRAHSSLPLVCQCCLAWFGRRMHAGCALQRCLIAAQRRC